MPRSAPGASTGFPRTSTDPEVAGNCGVRPAIRRSTVDFPHPDGPRIVTNSILVGMSSTTNETSLIAVNPLSYVFVTRSKTTTGGLSGVAAVVPFGAVSDGAADSFATG